jgi:hypothetical protein
MRIRDAALLALAVAITAQLALAGEVTFATRPVVKKAGGKTTISFAVSAKTDVEVAILDKSGKVVRHLAAGVLGAKAAPPAPLKAGLSQKLEWDGKDDYGEAVKGGPFKIRVRAGMSARLDRIVGGDPYAYYSKEMGQGDHAAWRVTGLEAKSDGKVYVLGNANNYGPPALRQYDAEGNYLKTVFPPPAGKPIADVKGWGVTVKADGTYMPQYNDLRSPALGKTLICGTRGRIANLVPSPGKDQLLLEYGCKGTTIKTDGTLRAYQPRPFFGAAKLPGRGRLIGPGYYAPAPDGKSLYVSGLFSCKRKRSYSRVLGADATGFWRDGQVWKLDLATRKMSVFFALDEKKVLADMKSRGGSIGHSSSMPCAALHGVAVDAQGRVFICDRQNERVVILDSNAKVLREIPVKYPDAIALNPTSKAIYVTTRFGNYHRKGEMKLLKFSDWTKDSKPSLSLPLCKTGTYRLGSLLTVTESTPSAGSGREGKVLVWVAYSTLPVRIYQDTGAGLKLFKDFYEAGQQRALDLQHMIADPVTEDVYIADGWNHCFRIRDWKDPKFVRCMTAAKKPLRALSLGIDYRNRYIYCHADRKPVTRYKMNGDVFTAAPAGGSNAFTPTLSNDWRIGLGLGCRGIAAAPDGSLATLGALGKRGYSGYLRFFKADPAKAPWQGVDFKSFFNVIAAGARFDPKGNLYVGKLGDRKNKGRIYKYVPTGSLASGNLFPTEPKAAAKAYDIDYGYPHPGYTRTPRFGVDGWGRIYYPTSLLPRVSVIDNEGNTVLSFGTYGNRDSMGGLKGDLVPTRGVPLAWPNSVDATDDYIYVSDIVNIRLLRLAKKFAAAETVGIK